MLTSAIGSTVIRSYPTHFLSHRRLKLEPRHAFLFIRLALFDFFFCRKSLLSLRFHILQQTASLLSLLSSIQLYFLFLFLSQVSPPPYFLFLFFITTRRKLAQSVNASLAPDDSYKQHQYLSKKHNKRFDITKPSTSVCYSRLTPSFRTLCSEAGHAPSDNGLV